MNISNVLVEHTDSKHVKMKDCEFAHKKCETRWKADLGTHIEAVHGRENFYLERHNGEIHRPDSDNKFAGKSYPELHSKTIHCPKKFACKNCDKIFTYKQCLESHYLKVHGPKSFVCRNCGKKFGRKVHLDRHNQSGHSSERFECKNCKKKFGCKFNLELHSKNIHDSKEFKCKNCDEKFSCKYNLKTHIMNIHGPEKFICRDCGVEFKNKTNLQRHNREVHGCKQFVCIPCGMKFSRKSNLATHTRNVHGCMEFECEGQDAKYSNEDLSSQPIISDSEKFICRDCGVKFKNKTKLGRHKREVHSPKQFLCVACGIKFSRKSNLATHTRTFHEFECEGQDAKYSNEDLSSQHIISKHFEHSQQKFASGDDSEERLLTSTEYSQHIENPNGLETFECEICDLKLDERILLVLHNLCEHS